MKQSLYHSQNNTETGRSDILSREEKKRFKNYHLPLFTCPYCGEMEKGDMVNLMGSPCVNCGGSITLEEFGVSSLEQYRKQDFAFHLDINNPSHQSIIKKFQNNVLWECDGCGKHNLNLPKKADGNPDYSTQIGCDGCGNPYEPGIDFLPFWALKGFGFDDGDDSSNTYELKKLGETQLLWLQAVQRARKKDAQLGGNTTQTLDDLVAQIEFIKQKSKSISGGKWRDGQKIIYFLQEYITGKNTSVTQKVTQGTRRYLKEVIATNDSYQKTPHRPDRNRLAQYVFNLSHLDGSTMIWTGIGSTLSLIAALAFIEQSSNFTFEDVSHQVSLQREDKGRIALSYTLEREEPYYRGGVQYKTVTDTSGQQAFEAYASQTSYYRLEINTEASRETNGWKSLDTGEDRWVSQTCPETSSSSESSGGGSWGGSSGGGGGSSSGMGFGGSGDLFYKPENPVVAPYQDITLKDTIEGFSNTAIMILLGASPAYASDCGYWEDVEVSARRYITLQHYSVWDWKTQQWFSSDFIAGMEYHQSFATLQERILTDTNDQRIIGENLILRASARDEEGTSYDIPVILLEDWLKIGQHIGEDCKIEKSMLRRIFEGKISDDDIKEQCSL